MDKVEAFSFLNSIQPQNGFIEFRCIKEKEIKQFFTLVCGIEILNELEKLNDQGFNIYFSPFTRRTENGTKENSCSTKCFWVDIDVERLGLDEKDILKSINDLDPSYIVSSGHGLHVYWMLYGYTNDSELVESINRGLAEKLHGDVGAINTSAAVIRLPGSLNTKKEPFVACKILSSFYGGTTLEVMSKYASKEIKEWKKFEQTNWNEFLKLTHGEGNRNNAAAKVAGKILRHVPKELWELSGWTTLKEWNTKNNPPLEETELRTVFESLVKKETKRQTKEIEKVEVDPDLPTSIGYLLKKEFPPTESYFGDRIITPQSKTLICGPAKIGKSFFAMALALHMSTGSPFLDFEIPRALKVLYVQAEMPEYDLQDRFKGMIHGEEINNDLLYTQTKMFKLNTPNGKAGLEKSIQAIKPEVVILDPFGRYHSANENDAKEIGEIIDFFDILIEKYSVALIVLHHDKKPGIGPNEGLSLARGSAVLTNWIDSFIGVKYEDYWKKIVKISFDLRKAVCPEPFLIKKDEHSLFQRFYISQPKEENYGQV